MAGLFDVIVVGGGPIGSHAAYKLAAQGHRVIVLERKLQPGGKFCCTGIVGMECVKTFAIEDAVILRKVNSGSLFSPSGNRIRLHRQETQACILDRAALDMSMASQAQAKGAEYVFDCMVTDAAVGADRVRVKADRGGKELSFEAKSAIIANGFGLGLTERVGLGRIGDYALGAQAEVAANIDETEVYFGRDIAPGFFAWLVPTSQGKARAGLLTRKSPQLYLSKLLDSLVSQGKIISSNVKPGYGGVPVKPLPRTYGDRLLVIGDAAGQVKPITGGGIYYGLLCADIAFETLHEALEAGDLSARRLAAYERTWKKKIGRELTVGYRARKLFERLSDKQIDRLFEVMKASRIDEALLEARDLSFDWHSGTILKLMGYGMVARTFGLVKNPFKTPRS